MRSHTLIIGGTGMLSETSVALASSTEILTSVARTKRSLAALDASLRDFKGIHHHMRLDWSDREGFVTSLANHIKEIGFPSLVVAWLHDDTLGVEVAQICSSVTTPCHFFQARGSAAHSPHANAPAFAERFKRLPGITYHQIILGFMLTSSGSRWLTNAEISAGVLRAIEKAAPLSVVGVVEPWGSAP